MPQSDLRQEQGQEQTLPSTILATQSSGAGAFSHFDLSQVSTPCFVVDEAKIESNLKILAEIKQKANVKVLAALKAFSMWRLAPLVTKYLDGACSSGLWESRLATKHYVPHKSDFEVTSYCAAYKAQDIDELAQQSKHLIFNSPEALRRFGPQVKPYCSLGLRVNPLHREGHVDKYDPCAPGSRLGTPYTRLNEVFADPELSELIDGIHLHTLCEQDLPPLVRTWEAFEPHIAPYYDRLSWLNLGGGHHITRPDYDRAGVDRFPAGTRSAKSVSTLS